MTALFPHGCGVFDFFEGIEPQEREEILEWVIQSRRRALGSEAEARRWLEDFRQELDRTRSAFPGVERRRTSLEKTSQLIEERLLRALKPILGGSATEFVGRLMFGDQSLGFDLGNSDADGLGFISARLVREGAEALDKLDAEVLFAKDGGWEEYHLDSFRRWRQVFRETAAQGELLFVGVC